MSSTPPTPATEQEGCAGQRRGLCAGCATCARGGDDLTAIIFDALIDSTSDHMWAGEVAALVAAQVTANGYTREGA
jgi:hypothetical protein